MPLLEGLRVARSEIHGYGVVATRLFKQDETVCHGDGIVHTPHPGFNDTYSLVLPAEDTSNGKPLLFDLVCQTRWINHSCDPNTEVMLEWDEVTQTMSAWWVALRDISVGEELTYDYAFAADFAEPCTCGARTCKGVIVDVDPDNLRQLSEPLRALMTARS